MTAKEGSVNHNAYDLAYQKLNDEQRLAVDTLDGPVMVIAGPGTGKTQILALRIARILDQTDTQAHNILCLTYTDAGAINMRKRLLQFIGSEAYKIHVHTFHSFCNEVIQDHQEFFPRQRVLHHISDLEKAQLFRKLIDGLPLSNPLRKLKGDLYFEATRLDKLFSLMKREFWSPQFMLERTSAAIEVLKNDPDSISSRGKTKGQIKSTVKGKIERLELLMEAVKTFDTFQAMMQEAGRYDFDDMIHWVVTAFQEHDELLAIYQERFLYTLVDEYQDTNGAQNKVIELLSNFWDEPNLFVVGDPDQAIFRFQGANTKSILDHNQKYDPTLIVLKNNYRSPQEILDASRHLIEQGKDSISDLLQLDAALAASGPHAALTETIAVDEYLKTNQEEADTVEKIEALLKAGVRPAEIAVIYRKHAQATNLLKVFGQRGISFNVKQRTDILHEPLIINLISILRYLQSQLEAPGSQDALLFEILHYRFLGIDPLDLAKVAAALWKPGESRNSLRFSITQQDLLKSFDLSNPQAFLKFARLIDTWVSRVPHESLQVVLEKILKEGQVFKEVMTSDHRTYEMQLLATFFNYLKAECRRQPGLTLAAFIALIDEMKEIGLQLPMQNLIKSQKGIQMLTAHGAKGLEFEHVFLIGCSNTNWKNQAGRHRQYSLPDNVVDPSSDADIDDERRLFYVAMTRTKKKLNISYPAQSSVDMPVEPNRFLSEAKAPLPQEQTVPEPRVIDFYDSLLNPLEKSLPLLDHALIERVVERIQLSSTALNNYLECPRTFYFRSILRVPLANSPHLGYGNAVHNALQSLIINYNQGIPFSDKALVEFFESEMKKDADHFSQVQFETYSENGRNILPKYLEEVQSHWESCKKLEPEKPLATTEHRGVPIRGRIDLIEHLTDGRYRVVDFKTGRFDSKKVKTPQKLTDIGGNYWRQMVFYKILLNESNQGIPMDEGCMSFVEPDTRGIHRQETFLIDFGQVDFVSNQIRETWDNIQNHNFDRDCGEPNCYWCNFVRNEYVLSPAQVNNLEENIEEIDLDDSLDNSPDDDLGQLVFNF